MKKAILLLTSVSSVLMGCHDHHEDPPPPPMQNEVVVNFLGSTGSEKRFGNHAPLSSVECQFSLAQKKLKIVAYQFYSGEDLQITETMQITDYGVENKQSGFLVTDLEDPVPSFVYLKNGQSNIEYGDESSCSTYYEVLNNEIRGNVMCASLDEEFGNKKFVSVEFQCRDQDYLLFEVKQEML